MYQSIPAVAQKLRIPEQLIEAFLVRGWITAVERNGVTFLPAHQQYLMKFIQHLREKIHLSDEQVSIVLRYEQPPYSLEQVEAILRMHAPAL
jgi:hypothetical protein